jgi:DNA-binding NtrC family response regulator
MKRDMEPARKLSVGSDAARVLIVDDELRVRELLSDYLTTVGDEVLTAATCAEALDAVPIFRPEVVLTDMVMPGLSGADLLDALRRAGLSVPVILMSGYPITAPEGFFATLRKPFDLRQLAELVTAAVRQARNLSA